MWLSRVGEMGREEVGRGCGWGSRGWYMYRLTVCDREAEWRAWQGLAPRRGGEGRKGRLGVAVWSPHT